MAKAGQSIGYKVHVVGARKLESPSTYIVAADDPEKAADPELAGMTDGEIREIEDKPDSVCRRVQAGKVLANSGRSIGG